MVFATYTVGFLPCSQMPSLYHYWYYCRIWKRELEQITVLKILAGSSEEWVLTYFVFSESE